MTVLACIDRSRYTASVCEYAARAASRLGVTVDLLHAIDWQPAGPEAVDRSGRMTLGMADTALEEFTRLNETRNRLAQEQARHLLEEASAYVRASGVEVVRERIVFGQLVDHLHDYDQDARLIVVGRRGEREGQAASHLGSNLERIVRSTRHPVLIVPVEPRDLSRFVVAYDGGASSRKAIDMLTRETLLLEAECHLLMVGAGTEEHWTQLAEAERRLRDAGYQVTADLRSGDADDVIIDRVRSVDADLLVMGAYGHSRIREMIIGSTTTALLRSSPVAVLVVR